MKQFETHLCSNDPVAGFWKSAEFAWPEDLEPPRPGQFFTLRASRYFDPLLRRPFAFSGFSPPTSSRPASASVIYQIRGGATRLFAGLGPGASIDVIGPLGKAFPDPASEERPILAAGGIGLGPILFLARSFAMRGIVCDFLAGFRDASSIPAIDFPDGSIVCTDDGSSGFHGRPTDWISRNALMTGVRLYACGPTPMLGVIAALATEHGWKASLSAEQWMACGIGACMGCALPRPGGAGFLRACADGPVFDRDDIDWKAEASR